MNDEALAHEMIILDNKHCENSLKQNLLVDQPDIFETGGQNVLRNIMEDSKTLCVGQLHKHSFENEEFYVKNVKKGSSQASYEKAPGQRMQSMKVLLIPIVAFLLLITLKFTR